MSVGSKKDRHGCEVLTLMLQALQSIINSEALPAAKVLVRLSKTIHHHSVKPTVALLDESHKGKKRHQSVKLKKKKKESKQLELVCRPLFKSL